MPRAPKKCATTGCEERVRGVRHCPEHNVAWAGSDRRNSHDSYKDRQLAKQVRQEEPWCRDCGAPTQVAGHIVAEALGGPYTRANLKGQCTRCNNAQVQVDAKRHIGS